MKKKWILLGLEILVLIGFVAGILYLNRREHINSHIIINDTEYSRDITALDLSGVAEPELSKVAELQELTSLDLRDTGITIEDYSALQEQLPQCNILWQVPFQGSYYPLDTTQLTFTEATEEDLKSLPYLRQLSRIDLRGCTDYALIAKMQQDYPQCEVLYTVKLAPGVYEPNIQSLAIAQTELEAFKQALPFLPNLKAVLFLGAASDPEAIYALTQENPQIDFIWSFELHGLTLSSEDTFFDLSEIPLENTQELENALKYFKNLQKVDMVHCGISNEDMEALNQRYENTLFVWSVQIGEVEVRTDITYFMPYKLGIHVDNKEVRNLRYCTEIICLDLGHQEIEDTDYLNTLTKMEYMVLADTAISDISCCANMPNLKYLEIFLTKVRDLTPLQYCTKLEDLNMSYNYPKDVTPILGLKNLKHLWMRGYEFEEQQKQLKEALPDTEINFSHGSSTGEGWRQIPNYYAMRDILGMHYMYK